MEVVTSNAVNFIDIFLFWFLASLEFLDKISQLLHYKMSSVFSSLQLHLWSTWSLFWAMEWVVTSFPILLPFIFYLQRHSDSKPRGSSRTFPSVCLTYLGSNVDNHNELLRIFQTLRNVSTYMTSSELLHNLGGIRRALLPIMPLITHVQVHCWGGRKGSLEKLWLPPGSSKSEEKMKLILKPVWFQNPYSFYNSR